MEALLTRSSLYNVLRAEQEKQHSRKAILGLVLQFNILMLKDTTGRNKSRRYRMRQEAEWEY